MVFQKINMRMKKWKNNLQIAVRNAMRAKLFAISGVDNTRIQLPAMRYGRGREKTISDCQKFVDGLASYESLVRVPATRWLYSVLVPDVLRYFDLPDLRKAIAEKLT